MIDVIRRLSAISLPVASLRRWRWCQVPFDSPRAIKHLFRPNRQRFFFTRSTFSSTVSDRPKNFHQSQFNLLLAQHTLQLSNPALILFHFILATKQVRSVL